MKAYIPEGRWYDAFSNASLVGGEYEEIDCPLGQVSVLCRGGSIIPLHQGGTTSAEVHNSTFNLIVAMPELVSKSPHCKQRSTARRSLYTIFLSKSEHLECQQIAHQVIGSAIQKATPMSPHLVRLDKRHFYLVCHELFCIVVLSFLLYTEV